MDIQMPGVDGLEAIRRIRADGTLAQTPIIAVTALALPRDRERCLEAGADEYMAKPVSLRLLVQTIESLRKRRAETDRDTGNDEASPLS
jgi:CheY-like chemotaxis protein